MAHKKILRTIVGTLLAEQRFIFILQGTFGICHRSIAWIPASAVSVNKKICRTQRRGALAMVASNTTASSTR